MTTGLGWDDPELDDLRRHRHDLLHDPFGAFDPCGSTTPHADVWYAHHPFEDAFHSASTGACADLGTGGDLDLDRW